MCEELSYTIDETAKKCNISKDTVRRHIKRGIITAYKAQGRYGEEWRIPETEIQKFQNKSVPVPEQVTEGQEREIKLEEVKDMIKTAMREVVKEEIEKGLSIMQNSQESLMREHYARVDTLLRDRCLPKVETKSIWKRLFS